MVKQLNCGEEFAGFKILGQRGGHLVVDRYLAQDESCNQYNLRIFRGFNILDPKSVSAGVGYEVKVEGNSWRLAGGWDACFTGNRPSKWKEVHDECGDHFEYFQNRLAITEELSGLPGFPELVATGSYNGHLYFATKFIEGQDLRQKIINRGIQPDEKLKLMHKLVLPLEQMHKMNLLHNDVKPGNYIVGSNGTIVLMDFDLSLHSERKIFGGKSTLWHEHTKNGLGTYKYIAPEIVSRNLGVGLTEFSDVWGGLGVTPYYLLTGGLPFTGRDMDYLSRAIREEDPTRLDRLLSEDFPQRERVSDLVHWSLEKSWHKRPRAIDFRRELEGILTEEGIDWNEPMVVDL